MNSEDQLRVEIADPTYNDLAPLSDEQLAAVADLGFEKAEVNFARDFAPNTLGANALEGLILRVYARVFGGDPTGFAVVS